MIAPLYPLCDLLRREHRLIRLSLMACYVGDATPRHPMPIPKPCAPLLSTTCALRIES